MQGPAARAASSLLDKMAAPLSMAPGATRLAVLPAGGAVSLAVAFSLAVADQALQILNLGLPVYSVFPFSFLKPFPLIFFL